ncbi:MAG: glycosyltransferase [Rhodospirillales bacterium]
MRVVMFYHSLVSDWNHGNAHFLRGIASELLSRGHEVRIFEPEDGWSFRNLVADHGEAAIRGFHRAYPQLSSTRYRLASLDLDGALEGADLVIVHEWNEPELVRTVGAHRARNPGYRLLFHDTHHQSVTDRDRLPVAGLEHYDGVLAFGRAVRDLYLERGWARRAWVWHEAADTRVFRPIEARRTGDLVWIGNWGDDERSAEIREFLIEPAHELGLNAEVYGVRYPEEALAALANAGIRYCGWAPNYEVPGIFARFRATVHIPRKPYVSDLPGIPTIRVFEALACGIPLITASWDDCEHLFTPGEDYLVARNGSEMKRLLRRALSDDAGARELAGHGLKTILSRHTCAHRVDELMRIFAEAAGTPAGAGAAV